jgi:hypothetical protein
MAARTSRADHKKVLRTAEELKRVRSNLILTGRIVNGKLEIDQHVLDEIAKAYPRANKSFIAVNAPFDPKAVSKSDI